MHSEAKFTGKSTLYDRYRPGYPKRFFIELFTEYIGAKDNFVIADIGAGTGIFTELVATFGTDIIAIEPNDDMRSILKERMENFTQVTCVNGSAEKTALADKSVDLITVAQAYHWFDAIAFKKECERILKNNGLVMLIWNSRDHTSSLNMETAKISKKYCPDFQGVSGGINIERLDLQQFFTHGYEHYAVSNPLKMDKEHFIGRNLSASYAPKEDDFFYEEFVGELEFLFEKYSKDETILVPNDLHVYVGAII
ncbi:class I SAM-dependent methyltransferase [Niallia sp. Sow4_A1]|uniref:Class I SAM-dependent methyltransferase n=1 Tax=Niallia hominis TaxID=3133173 RepID=A0ABV1F2B2_9BACI|nr:class I SAM-dependent methyltransferase [Niallia sp. MER TA 168]MCM3363819.1 class I SAM-dependent methyltransferase [Niallia sp. MER TA 168]